MFEWKLLYGRMIIDLSVDKVLFSIKDHNFSVLVRLVSHEARKANLQEDENDLNSTATVKNSSGQTITDIYYLLLVPPDLCRYFRILVVSSYPTRCSMGICRFTHSKNRYIQMNLTHNAKYWCIMTAAVYKT